LALQSLAEDEVNFDDEDDLDLPDNSIETKPVAAALADSSNDLKNLPR